MNQQDFWLSVFKVKQDSKGGGVAAVGPLNLQTSVEPGSQGYQGADIPPVEGAEGD